MDVRRWLCGAFLALLGAQAVEAAALDDRDRAAIEALENRVAPLPRGLGSKEPAPLAQRMAETRVPAVSVAFIEDGRVKWARAYGEAVAGSGRGVTPETRFQAASLSKAVAAAGALRLVDRGRLDLDEDVNRRLRAWRVPAGEGIEPATLRRLLSHTAGLTVSGYGGYRPGRPAPTVVQSLEGAPPADTPPVRRFAAPGSRIAYSGGGYTVAQLLMSEATGTEFARLMRRTLLRPAGMTRSGFDRPSAEAARRDAGGHDANGAPIPGGAHVYPELAAAGLWTTPSDYGRFLVALQDSWAGRRGALLRPATARAMMTPVLSNYGLGVNVIERGGRRAVSHGGTNEGFQSRFVAFLDGAREGVVIMTNGDNGGLLAAGLQRTIARAYGWDDAPVPPIPPAPND